MVPGCSGGRLGRDSPGTVAERLDRDDTTRVEGRPDDESEVVPEGVGKNGDIRKEESFDHWKDSNVNLTKSVGTSIGSYRGVTRVPV